MTSYLQFIAVPKSRHTELKDYEAGMKLFTTVGCASCHTPRFETTASIEAVLNGVVIYPFTDLLLHDMGEELSDVAAQNDILPFSVVFNAREWRTPPLWGIGMLPTVNGHQQLLHDGRAENVEEAILWHSGEAEETKNNFKNLTAQERTQLIDFVNKL